MSGVRAKVYVARANSGILLLPFIHSTYLIAAFFVLFKTLQRSVYSK